METIAEEIVKAPEPELVEKLSDPAGVDALTVGMIQDNQMSEPGTGKALAITGGAIFVVSIGFTGASIKQLVRELARPGVGVYKGELKQYLWNGYSETIAQRITDGTQTKGNVETGGKKFSGAIFDEQGRVETRERFIQKFVDATFQALDVKPTADGEISTTKEGVRTDILDGTVQWDATHTVIGEFEKLKAIEGLAPPKELPIGKRQTLREWLSSGTKFADFKTGVKNIPERFKASFTEMKQNFGTKSGKLRYAAIGGGLGMVLGMSVAVWGARQMTLDESTGQKIPAAVFADELANSEIDMRVVHLEKELAAMKK